MPSKLLYGLQVSMADQFQAIDPKNFAPFFAYRPGYVEAGDLPNLMDEGYLRVAYIVNKKSI